MNLIVAVDEKWGIGKDGGLLAHLPEDMKYFRETTTGKVVVMGRCNKAYVTYIHRTFDVDTDFENLDQDENWKLESVSDGREHEGISFEFRIYRRVR